MPELIKIGRAKGKCGGRSYAERDPELVDMARWLHHNADGRPYSLRKVASELLGYGYTTPSGKPYSAAAVASMVQPQRWSPYPHAFVR